MNLLRPETDGFFARLASVLFPPKFPVVKDLSYTTDYVNRTTRDGVERPVGCKMMGGWVEGTAQEKRIIALPGRVV